MPHSHRPIDILLVEDNPGDILLIKEALQAAKVSNKLHVLNDGESAIEYLRDSKKRSGPPRPYLIMLDLNLPKRNGQEVLQDIKNDPSLRSIPVVIMTSSDSEEDIIKAYDLQANCYITKPVDFNQLLKVVAAIEDFWLSVVQLPPGKKQ